MVFSNLLSPCPHFPHLYGTACTYILIALKGKKGFILSTILISFTAYINNFCSENSALYSGIFRSIDIFFFNKKSIKNYRTLENKWLAKAFCFLTENICKRKMILQLQAAHNTAESCCKTILRRCQDFIILLFFACSCNFGKPKPWEQGAEGELFVGTCQ